MCKTRTSLSWMQDNSRYIELDVLMKIDEPRVGCADLKNYSRVGYADTTTLEIDYVNNNIFS